mmetsp:Transcript_30795/g.87102  ORF Transcript_30795/g.87102 Transcript_30795/m.87102 type:complete len:236 (-) Transcript_30795:821-1528(-)
MVRSLELSHVEAGHREGGGKGLDLIPQGGNRLISRQRLLEVLEQLPTLLLHLNGNGHCAVKELPNLPEVILLEATGCHGGGANADTAGSDGTGVTLHAVLVQGDVRKLTDTLHFAPGDAVWPAVPQQQVVVCAAGDQLVPIAHEGLCQSRDVLPNLLRVVLELLGANLLEGHGQSADLVVVGAALEGGEHRKVDLFLKVVHGALGLPSLEVVRRFWALAEEDHAGAGATQGLVSR